MQGRGRHPSNVQQGNLTLEDLDEYNLFGDDDDFDYDFDASKRRYEERTTKGIRALTLTIDQQLGSNSSSTSNSCLQQQAPLLASTSLSNEPPNSDKRSQAAAIIADGTTILQRHIDQEVRSFREAEYFPLNLTQQHSGGAEHANLQSSAGAAAESPRPIAESDDIMEGGEESVVISAVIPGIRSKRILASNAVAAVKKATKVNTPDDSDNIEKVYVEEFNSQRPLTKARLTKRRERNKMHAKLSRDRKNYLIESLQREVERLRHEVECLESLVLGEIVGAAFCDGGGNLPQISLKGGATVD